MIAPGHTRGSARSGTLGAAFHRRAELLGPREGGEFKDRRRGLIAGKYGYYFDRLDRDAIPNMQKLQAGFRAAGIEVLYTTIESLT